MCYFVHNVASYRSWLQVVITTESLSLLSRAYAYKHHMTYTTVCIYTVHRLSEAIGKGLVCSLRSNILQTHAVWVIITCERATKAEAVSKTYQFK